MRITTDVRLPDLPVANTKLGPVFLDEIECRGGRLRVEGRVKTALKSVSWRLDGDVAEQPDGLRVTAMRFSGAGPLNAKVQAALGGLDRRGGRWSLRTNAAGTEAELRLVP